MVGFRFLSLNTDTIIGRRWKEDDRIKNVKYLCLFRIIFFRVFWTLCIQHWNMSYFVSMQTKIFFTNKRIREKNMEKKKRSCSTGRLVVGRTISALLLLLSIHYLGIIFQIIIKFLWIFVKIWKTAQFHWFDDLVVLSLVSCVSNFC